MAAVYVFRADSISLETCILTIVSCYIGVLQMISAFHPTHIIGLLLLASSCAYGLCATDLQHIFSLRFSRCAATMAVVSCIAAVAHTGFLCEYFNSQLHEHDDDDDLLIRSVPKAIPTLLGFIMALFLKAIEVVLAGVLAVKHARISMHQGPRNFTTTMIPTTMEMRESQPLYNPQVASNYGNPPAQAVVGQPAYL